MPNRRLPCCGVMGFLVVVLQLLTLHTVNAQAQTPVPVPVPTPIPSNPALGIIAQSYRANTPLGLIEGVEVTSDRYGRPLFARTPSGGWQRLRFRVGWDVILEVNGVPVRSVADLRASTQLGWNTLRIWDRATGITDEYWMHLK